MESYSILAKYYDSLMQDFDYLRYLELIEKYVKGDGVDLCCGSGTITIALSKLSHKMIGVDFSSQMLSIANQKAFNEGEEILWIQQKSQNFDAKKEVDFVTCVCDGINYISIKDFEKLIVKLDSYLKKGGFFIFDISSEYKLRNILGNNFFFEDLEELTYLWQNKLTKDKITMDITFFVSDKDDKYTRYDEYHTQYIHKKEDVLSLLNKKYKVKMFDGETFKSIKDNSSRIIFVCEKR